MSDLIHLAPNLRLDADYVAGGTFALLGKKGAGKSFTTRVLAEEFWRTGVQFVLIDPMGANWGLRSSADGQGEGLPIPIFGGKHADAPLERTAGALMADLVVQDRLSMILDLSEFGSHAAERQFVHDFLERLYRTNDEILIHVLLDEADLYAPQKPAPGDQAVKGVVDNVVRRGRNKAIAITLITQRSAVLDKDVLTQVDGVVLLRLTGPQDRDAAMRWVEDHGEPEQNAAVRASLSELANGEAWVWIPELRVFERVQVRMSRTFDSSPTRTRKGSGPAPKGYADVDLAVISAKIAGTVERAKAEDPKELRKRIRELERQIASTSAAESVEVEVEVERIPDWVGSRVVDIQGVIKMLVKQIPLLDQQVTEFRAEVEGAEPSRASAPRVAMRERSSVVQSVPKRQAPVSVVTNDGEVKLGRTERAILGVLAQFPQGRTKSQISILSGYSIKSSGFANALSKLRTTGLISPAGSDPILITEDGVEHAGEVQPILTGRELLGHWVTRLGKAERAFLEQLYEVYPGMLTKQDLSDRTGYSTTSSGFANALSKLRTLELIEGYQEMAASEAFFS